MEAGGYRNHEFWLSDAWSWLSETGVSAPLYWVEKNGVWFEQTLAGERELVLDFAGDPRQFFRIRCFCTVEPVAAFRRNSKWERAAPKSSVAGMFVEDGYASPGCSPQRERRRRRDARKLLGVDVETAYRPYPRYAPPEGALGEYNGKFMNGQYVLRGGSCATSRDHIRNDLP